jgi:hypothetical protein
VDRRLARIVRNETLFRRVNEAVEEVSEELEERSWVPDGGRVEFHCECGREGCDEHVALTAEEYERVHRQSDRFVVFPGHMTVAIERLVEEHEGYCVVDKLPEAEDLLDDPRTRPGA